MNVFAKIGHALKDIGIALKDVALWLPSKLAKLEKVLAAERAVEPELKSSLAQVVADAAAFAAVADAAVVAKGLSWTADTAAVASAEKLIADLPSLLKAIEDAATALEA